MLAHGFNHLTRNANNPCPHDGFIEKGSYRKSISEFVCVCVCVCVPVFGLFYQKAILISQKGHTHTPIFAVLTNNIVAKNFSFLITSLHLLFSFHSYLMLSSFQKFVWPPSVSVSSE